MSAALPAPPARLLASNVYLCGFPLSSVLTPDGYQSILRLVELAIPYTYGVDVT